MINRHSNRQRKLDAGDSKKHHKRNSRKRDGKVVFINFDAKSPQAINYVRLSEKIEIKLEFRLKKNEEYFFYPCDKMLKSREDLFSATVSGRKGLRIVHLSFVMRPSLPGGGSNNAFFISIVDLKEGVGTTSKVGILNVTDDISGITETKFVVSKITPHLIRYSGKKVPEIQSFIDVPLKDFWPRLSNKDSKNGQLPEGGDYLKIKLPKAPKTDNRARNLVFDPFEGIGIALVGKNKFCQYGINYLQTKYSTIFPAEGASFSEFYYVPLSQIKDPVITHIAIRAKAFGELKDSITEVPLSKSRINDERMNRLFSNGITMWKLSDNNSIVKALSSYL